MIEEQLARASQARGAGEQHHAQFFFQFPDGVRQRRLFNMPLLRCTGEVRFFGDGQESAQKAESHVPFLRRWFSRLLAAWPRCRRQAQ